MLAGMRRVSGSGKSFFHTVSAGWLLMACCQWPSWIGLAQAPVIVTQPAGRTVRPGQSVGFSVEARGEPPLSYLWRKNQAPQGGTNASLAFPSVTLADAGDYEVVVVNPAGSATSGVARLVVKATGPVFSVEPTNRLACSGESVSLVAAADFGVTYQWQYQGTNLPGATQARLDLAPVSPSHAGPYRVIATDISGAITSAVANLTVDPLLPVITFHPLNARSGDGSTITLRAAAFSCSPTTWQWRRHGTNLPGITQAQWDMPVLPQTTGKYDVVVANANGAVTSLTATVESYQEPPAILANPLSREVYAGSQVTFSANASGWPPPSFQWFFQGQPVPGAVSPSYSLYADSTNQSGAYFAVASNPAGAATTQVAHLTVQVVPPSLVAESSSQDVAVGESALLWVNAGGWPPPVYQWFFNGQPLAGATNFHLWREPAGPEHEGAYQVVASNNGGATTGAVTWLTVHSNTPLDRWHWRLPQPQGNDLQAVVWGGGRWLAVGRGGALVTSADEGQNWQARRLGRAHLYQAAAGLGQWVAVGSVDLPGRAVPRLLLSSNGLDWEPVETGSSRVSPYNDVAFGNGRFVVAGAGNTLLLSTNGRSWTEQVKSGGAVDRVAFANGHFVALGGNGSISADGIHWTNWNLPGSVAWQDLTYGNGRYVACGLLYDAGAGGYVLQVYSSSDGLIWKGANLAAGYHPRLAVAFGAGRFVLAGGSGRGLLMHSSDGSQWQDRSPSAGGELYGVGFANGLFVAVGDGGSMRVSNDGVNWTVRHPGGEAGLGALAQGGGFCVAAGEQGSLLVSRDGRRWNSVPTGVTNHLRAVVFGGDRFVAVGDADNAGMCLLRGGAGGPWERVFHPGAANLHGAAFGQGLFVAVGDGGTVLTSPDTFSWSNRLAGDGRRLRAVVRGDNQFVAVGEQSVVVASADGVAWTVRKAGDPGDPELQTVACGRGLYLAGGKNGLLLRSSNGLDWDTLSAPGAGHIEHLTYGFDRFLAVGQDGWMASTTNGLHWVQHAGGAAHDLRAALFFDGAFLAAGRQQTLLQSGFMGPPRLRSLGRSGWLGFRIEIQAEEGSVWMIQNSSNLQDWRDLLWFEAGEEPLAFFDLAGPAQPACFFRARRP